MARKTILKKKPVQVEKPEVKFQPGIYTGKVISTTDTDIFIDFGRTGLIHLERDGKPTKYAKGQIVQARIAIINDPSTPNSTV